MIKDSLSVFYCVSVLRIRPITLWSLGVM